MSARVFRIREAVDEDSAIVAQFNVDMALETEGLTLDLALATEGVRNLVKQPKLGKYLVSEEISQDKCGNEVGTPAACTMYTLELSSRLGGLIYMIQSVFVVKDFRKMGAFR